MKEITVEPLLDKHFETKETCTMQELYHLVEDYRKKHPNVYVMYDRDYLHTVLEQHKDKFYWDSNANLIRKQYEIKCLCCGTTHKQYPDVEKFEKIKIFCEKVKFWSFKNKKIK
jgi:hypothetical protein